MPCLGRETFEASFNVALIAPKNRGAVVSLDGV
jgi:hypothetical protein